MKKARWLIPLLAIILTVLISVPVIYAVTSTKQLTGEIVILPGTKNVQVFQGPDYSSPITGFKVIISRGSQDVLAFRVVNNGAETITQAVHMLPATVPWGTLTLSQTDLGTLAPGDQADWSLTIDVPISASVGNYAVLMELYEP